KLTIRMLVQNGSLSESDPQRGLAHYLEHMAFNGTTHFPPGKLITTLQSLGLAFGAHTNAHTSFDETVYKLDLPDAKEPTLATGLQVMADWAGGMLILPEEVEKERGVILAEMRDRNTPGYREFLATARTRYAGLIIGERPPIGVSDTIAKADVELIRSYYDDWYRPDHLVVVVVGAIEPQKAIAGIESSFAALTNRSPVRERPSIGTVKTGTDFLCHHEAEDDNTAVSIELVRPTPHPHDTVELRKLYLLQELGERVLNRRFTDYAEKNPEGPILGGGSYSYQWMDVFIAGVQAQCRPGKALEAVRLIETERRRLMQFGPTPQELEIAVTRVRAQLDEAVAQAGTRTNPGLADGLYASVHNDQVFMSPEQARDLMAPWLASATPAEVVAAERAAWEPGAGHLMIAVVGRDDLGADGMQSTRQAYEQASTAHLDPPEVRTASVWAYGTVAGRGTVVQDTTTQHDIRQLVFANHACANIKRTDFQPNQVILQVRLEMPPQPRTPGLSELTSAAFMAGGLGKHSAQDLREIFAGTSAQVGGPSFSEDAAVFSGGCLPKDLDVCLQQLRAYITDPGWREQAEIRAKSAWLQELAALVTDLDAQVGRTFQFLAVGNAPQRRPVTIDEAKGASFAAARPWFQPVLEHAPLSISIVGDIDLARAAELATTYIGSLGERRPHVVMTDPHAPNVLANSPPIPAGLHRIEVPGTNPRALVTIAWPTDDFYDVRQMRRLGMLAECFSERLRIKIREELGQAYSPHASRSASEAYRGHGYLNAVVGVAPERVEDARAAVLAIAAELAEKGVDDELLSHAKEPTVKNLASYRQKNGYWLGSVMARCRDQPFRLDWAATMEEDYAAITAAEVGDLAKRFLVNDRALQVVGVCTGPPADAAPKEAAVEPEAVPAK
ncbi:MAG: insulinase family protein, partial [Planctomycetes bacterium]|nr:insulinase family protein [Planctomycetota bacterium]